MPIARKVKPEVNSAVREQDIERFIESKPKLGDDVIKNIGLTLYGSQINKITQLREMMPKKRPGAKLPELSQEDWIRQAIDEKIARDYPGYEAWKESRQ